MFIPYDPKGRYGELIDQDLASLSQLALVADATSSDYGTIVLTEGLWKELFGENFPPSAKVRINGFRIDCIHGNYTKKAYLNIPE